MNKNVLSKICQSGARVIIFDIDGTLKDLCREHNNALWKTLECFKVGKKRRKLIYMLNKVAMSMVKVGLFPTNGAMQRILVFVFAIMSFKSIKEFGEVYHTAYSKEICLFDGVQEFLETLSQDRHIYFSTINYQNYNLEEWGIPQEKIFYAHGNSKWKTYDEFLYEKKFIRQYVLIVGDNIFDDILSAKRLKTKCLLVNNYNSKLKEMFCRIINKNT